MFYGRCGAAKDGEFEWEQSKPSKLSVALVSHFTLTKPADKPTPTPTKAKKKTVEGEPADKPPEDQEKRDCVALALAVALCANLHPDTVVKMASPCK
jgi:hypothetical protein